MSTPYDRACELMVECSRVVTNRANFTVLCPDCDSPRIDIELHDFTPNKTTFNDVCFCKDCGFVFELVTKRAEK